MMQIRFGEDGVTVAVVNGPNTFSLTEKYADIGVEFFHRKRFWCRVAEPLRSLRVAAHVQAAMFIASEGTSKEEHG